MIINESASVLAFSPGRLLMHKLVRSMKWHNDILTGPIFMIHGADQKISLCLPAFHN
jgi:hypothetical protein